MEIIPAIDIIDGKCVRLTQGNYSNCKIYSSSPLEVAKLFEEKGFRRLHIVDLDGAKSSHVVNIKILENICKNTNIDIDFGGGIKSTEDIRQVFESGAKYACLGSIAQTNIERTKEWFELYGGERIIIGADVWNYKVCINGWRKVTDTSVFQLIDHYHKDIVHLMCTDITKDGMLNGPACELYKNLLATYPFIHLIASGGVSSKEDLESLRMNGINSVIVGKAIYEKKLRLEELCSF